MDENSRHEIKIKTTPSRHETEIVIQAEGSRKDAELGKLAPCLKALRTPPPQPTFQQWENARARLMGGIETSRGNFITTFRDKMKATDSAILRTFYYAVVVIGAVAIAAGLAAGAIILIETLLLEPANAMETIKTLF